jgi:hypothetical protein
MSVNKLIIQNIISQVAIPNLRTISNTYHSQNNSEIQNTHNVIKYIE